ncbi:elongation factor Ts [Shewanella sp. BC20]|uniref:elongation factor Ts n=1 Tax=Shewanella sp. BC20 TaxID=2004459 RepID=UPI0011B27CC1|nr:elongation factor Ts [Shewanella sp. BC20]
MGTAQKQKQIKELLSKLGLSIPNFAGLVYEALYIDDCGDLGVSDADEDRKFAEKIKKHLSRKTTPEEILDQYLEILAEQPGFEALQLGYIKSRYVPHTCLSDEMTEVMRQISVELDVRAEKSIT